jgi:hypothetical protein
VLMRRGMVVGGTFSVLVLLLAVGLQSAASDPDRAEIELAAMGTEDLLLDAAAEGPPEDVSAPVTTDPPTTTTTAPPATTAPTAADAPAPTTAAPPTTAPAAGTVAVGDSVMLGAQGALYETMPGIRVDAKVGRQFDNVLAVVDWYVAEGLVAGALVVHAGTNGTFSDADLDRLMAAAGGRRVLLVNAKVSRPWQDLVNQRMAAAADRHDNAVLVDWFSLASAHPEWFAADGAHLRPDGSRAFSELIRDNL